MDKDIIVELAKRAFKSIKEDVHSSGYFVFTFAFFGFLMGLIWADVFLLIVTFGVTMYKEYKKMLLEIDLGDFDKSVNETDDKP